MPVISKESMKQKGHVCIKVGKEAKESYLLKSVPQKLFKAKDVQDPNFKSGIPGWNGEKHRSLTAACYSKATVKGSCPQKCGKATKLKQHTRMLKYFSNLVSIYSVHICIVLTGLHVNIVCVSFQPALSLMHLTFGCLSVFLLVMQCELLHTTCQNYVSCYKNTIGTQDR